MLFDARAVIGVAPVTVTADEATTPAEGSVPR